ncbi:hypothetical protein T552_03135 [Pneumocystis carinii B80]|uniref:Uncharacterized protein n=1 Tax=Pneumocystis carinii (strain B80) TaxID=1408658 RepID=A0A0W4ZC01_PNEC8|nr:hypothetical protein T552_03135 [Pneumocystis carinii B80]KTW25861.1 hypothetical protein T552_03135 [Pneumocystis carinii B80]
MQLLHYKLLSFNSSYLLYGHPLVFIISDYYMRHKSQTNKSLMPPSIFKVDKAYFELRLKKFDSISIIYNLLIQINIPKQIYFFILLRLNIYFFKGIVFEDPIFLRQIASLYNHFPITQNNDFQELKQKIITPFL